VRSIAYNTATREGFTLKTGCIAFQCRL